MKRLSRRNFSGRNTVMKKTRIPLVTLLSLAIVSALSLLPMGAPGAHAQGQSTALERGYRTGYSDGFAAGSKDVGDQAAREFQNKEDYQQANRSYNQVWGPIEDYRDGYQQGYEAGYLAGYDRAPFNSSIPTGLQRRGNDAQSAAQPAQSQATPDDSVIVDRSGNPNINNVPTSSAPAMIPRNTFLIVELESGLSTETTQQGDRFEARVIEPAEYQGAILEGRVTRVKRPGRVKGVAELQLSFNQIRMPDNRSGGIAAELVEVVSTGRDDEGQVDREGGVRGKDSTKDDVSKVGAATGIGAIIGAITGGGHGAAIGAAIGGGIGAGGVLSKRGKDIHLDRGQQLKLKTSADARIQ